jgi:hypothetical protein
MSLINVLAINGFLDNLNSIGENTSFALKGINENVEIKWNVPDIEPDYLLEYYQNHDPF